MADPRNPDPSYASGRTDVVATKAYVDAHVSTSITDADNNTKIQVEESADENKIRFDTAGSERMIIDDSGKVGIATTSPTAPLHVTDTGDTDLVIIESTSSGSNHAPDLILFRNDSNPLDGDGAGRIEFRGKNDAGTPEEVKYAEIYSTISDKTDGTEDGDLRIRTIVGGTVRERITMKPLETVVNEEGIQTNFRVESDTRSAMLFVDGTNDKVGIGEGSVGGLSATLEVEEGGTFRATNLLTATVAGALDRGDHAGRYLLANNDVTLPHPSTAGEHYTILNTTGSSITIARGNSSDQINGATANATLASYKGATCIGIGSNHWIVLGV